MDVELIQVVGHMRDRRGEKIEVRHAIDSVMYNGREVALRHRKVDAKMVFMPHAPEDMKDEIRDQAAKIREESGLYTPIDAKHHTPPPIPKEVLEELDEGEDDEYDEEYEFEFESEDGDD